METIRRIMLIAVVSLISACGKTAPSNTPTVSSMTIGTSTLFTLVGQTNQLTATVVLSNQVMQAVSDAVWQSSNPVVATVSFSGLVTSLSTGTTTISATYQGHAATLTLTASTGSTGSSKVSVLYAMPQDRPFRADYAMAVQSAVANLQTWYVQQLMGSSFAVSTPQVETCQMPHAASFYPGGTYSKVLADVQACAHIASNSGIGWVLYADVEDGCKDPGRLGVGSPGLTILGSGDLHGLVGERVIDGCGVEYKFGVGRYVGGLGHEMGHMFGLSHPPGCDAGLAGCDTNALMWSGYALYPNTYLRADDKQILLASPFFK